MSKKCFTAVHCELHSKCEIAHQPYTNGYFQPTAVGEHCHHFKPLVFRDEELAEKLSRMAGAHE